MTMVNILLYFFIQFYLFLFCLLCQSAGPQAVRSQTDKCFSVMEAADASCGLDLLSSPICAFISSTSAKVAPPPAKPVEVFINSASDLVTVLQSSVFSSSVKRHVSMITFKRRPAQAF